MAITQPLPTTPPMANGNPAAPETTMAMLGRYGLRSDVVFAVGMLGILSVLLFPIPTGILDFLLSISITLSVLILVNVMFISKPLEFSSFPTILLIATMFRLALNIASTRLVLSHGHEGTEAAGQVIQAFGNFVMSGNVVIGIIVFAILTLINFIVITKGSGRIAEVSARFSLDAMPGKQMAIDADLSAGLIDEATARARRKELEDESTFFGAMDGASKFVRGDAIAGIVITFINLIGGIIIGVVQRDMPFSDAIHTYSLLTIGDGLVSQMPALIVSTAAGMLVTKSGVVGSTDKAVFAQLGRYPRSMFMVSGLSVFMALMPGLPMLPFMILACITGGMGYLIGQVIEQEKTKISEAEVKEKAKPAPTEEPIEQTLQLDYLRLELGYGLLPLINYERGHRLTEQIKALRKQLAKDLGFIMPPVRIQDNMQLPANNYVVKVKDIEAGRGDIRPDMLLVMDPKGGKIDLPGLDTKEPTFGLPAKWISEAQREEALFRNYTVVDPPTVITTHLTEMMKDNIAELLSYSETQKLLNAVPEEYKKLVEDTVPSQLSVGGVQRVLQNLIRELVSIRDLPTIMEAISETARATQNITIITEHVRSRLSRQICHANTNAEGFIPLITLSPEWEQVFAESLVGNGDEKQLALPPSRLQEFIKKTREVFEKQAMNGELPVLLTSPAIRPYVRAVVERFRPATVVMSQNEIHAKARIRGLGQL